MRRSTWKFKLTLLLVFFLVCFWASRLLYLSSLANSSIYRRNGFELSTFSAPFACDPRTLPPRVRMIRRANKNYVLLGHGFDDVVTNYNWDVEGDDGWENGLTKQMEVFLETIKSMEPSRTIFLDVGANIGTHMLYLASRGYEVHGFEPTHANYVLAHCALAISGLTGPIRFNHFGLGDKVESVCMDSVSWNMGDSRVNTTEHCPFTKQAILDTLDNYYERFLNGRKVALLKIDVQGYEAVALLHGTKLFDSTNAPEVVIFEYEPDKLILQGSDPRDLIRFFEARDYDIWHFGLKPFGVDAPDFINGTSVLWRENDTSLLEDISGGSYDLIAVKKAWKFGAEEAGYHFVGGTIQEALIYP